MALFVKDKKLFVLKEKQIAAFSEYMHDSFQKKAFLHLKKRYPLSTQNTTDEDLKELINVGINRAAKHKINDRADVLNYLEYCVVYGIYFDSDPNLSGMSKILKIRNLTGAAKMKRLTTVNPLTQETV